jgi:hypothetical protein
MHLTPTLGQPPPQDLEQRNCKYLEEQKKKKGCETSTLGINIMEINIVVSSSDSWYLIPDR